MPDPMAPRDDDERQRLIEEAKQALRELDMLELPDGSFVRYPRSIR